jgi:hypothetical protein
MQQASSRAPGEPGDCQLSLQGSKGFHLALNPHGVVTKNSNPMTGARGGLYGRSERGTTQTQENIFCNRNGQQIMLNGARLPR